MNELLGYTLLACMGIVLGLIGGGGSMLALPVLVYIMEIPTVTATAYSLFLVGSTAAVGAITQSIKKQVDWKAAMIFSIPSIPAVYLMRKWILPSLPEHLGKLPLSTLLMFLFAALMLVSGIMMITRRCEYCDKQLERKPLPRASYGIILLEGLLVGSITGLVGAGGGFLVVPALVMYANIPMRLAVGTSLLIIALKSMIGFVGDWQMLPSVDWKLLLMAGAAAFAGMLLGGRWNGKFREKTLKQYFGWGMISLSLIILMKEIMTLILTGL
ncbi:MAG: sulfite exporter TauE/SafE family protein [Cytophagaceae bacterium]|jgi:hypothetical protein|nr:sulfite exporter TauE/SafE family protein [Cytophagaceae bacterium]